MIIGWCLKDITSLTKKKEIYEKKGRVVRVIDIRDNMVILQNRKGDRFPANKNNVIWHDTRRPNI